MARYRFDDPQVEQGAGLYTQQRLQGDYYEARYHAEVRATRGYGTLAGWSTSLLFVFGLLAAMTLTNGVDIMTGLFLAAGVLPGTFLALLGTGRATADARLCGLEGAYSRLLWVDCYLVGLPGCLALGVLIVTHLGGAHL